MSHRPPRLSVLDQAPPVPPVEEALRFLEEERARPQLFSRPRRRIVGSPATVRAGIEAAAREYRRCVRFQSVIHQRPQTFRSAGAVVCSVSSYLRMTTISRTH